VKTTLNMIPGALAGTRTKYVECESGLVFASVFPFSIGTSHMEMYSYVVCCNCAWPHLHVLKSDFFVCVFEKISKDESPVG
jgi:hypothetical protein